ncbi:hypothetical protein BCR32DRAFT_280346 [Anaeromyces robustus]|uniref:AMP-dependent synthetase/ligase domain-containing protein n=1 Tax=Anaeromyces robustus TaxID=1754192 RepID=A0A1Y1X4S4_9FUNG|nr:hypothetical protein BCR32DRAFT_280346 [Anaeromyces robustus]|eukprot:ORX80645.1 hypothetical protein BCR32DRAFT_280346 [Anaeromyces robustus]
MKYSLMKKIENMLEINNDFNKKNGTNIFKFEIDFNIIENENEYLISIEYYIRELNEMKEINPKMFFFSNSQNIIDKLLLINKNYKVYDVQQHEYKSNINSIENINELDDICYVLLASRTIGKPKGTFITHFNIYNEIDFINIIPTRFKLFMNYEEFRRAIENVKIIYLGGESLSVNLCKHLLDIAIKLITDIENAKITIDRPIRNSNIYILDKYLKSDPFRIEGEIFIGGYNVGKGYLNCE